MDDTGDSSVEEYDEYDPESAEGYQSTTLYKATLLMWKVVPPIIMVVGTFGNTMIFVILRRMSLGGASNSMSVFFGALALSDILLLCTGFVRHWVLNTLSTDLRDWNVVLCKLHVFTVYLLGMTSAWFLVCMTVQRVMSVVWPHRVGVQCTRRKSTVTVAILAIAMVAINAHNLFALDMTTDGETDSKNNTIYYCDSDGSAPYLLHYDVFIFPWVDLVVASFIPSVILFISNAVLATSVARATRRANTLIGRQGQTAQQQTRARKKAASSLTITLICVSTTFLLLTLPMNIYLLVEPYLEPDTAEEEAGEELTYSVFTFLWYCNSAINFYIYCLTGTKFRAECKSLFCRCGKGGRSGGNNAARVYTLSAPPKSSSSADGEKSHSNGSVHRKMSF